MGFPFNSPFNDYMYAIDDFNDLGWFASDRYQPEGKVCVYVFAPNNSKRVYDYDTTDPALLTNVAMLNGIRHTWNDADKVRIAKQQLAQVMYGGNETQKKVISVSWWTITPSITPLAISVRPMHGRNFSCSSRRKRIWIR